MVHFPELEFEERNHVYLLEKVPVPSVTTIMKPLSEAYYSKIRDDVLEKAAKRGTAVHNAIETLIQFGFEDIAEEHKLYLKAFKDWKEQWNVEVIETESKIYHKSFRYAGTADLICKENGVLTLVDFKTTSVLSPMLLGVQLEAYKKALESHGIKVENVVGLQLKKDGTYVRATGELLPPSIECYQTFCSLLTVKGYLEKYKNK